MRARWIQALLVSVLAAWLAVVWMTWKPAPDALPNHTAVELKPGEQATLASGSWSESRAESFKSSVSEPSTSARREVPQALAQAQPGPVIQVVDSAGNPLPDAELVAFNEVGTEWTRWEADDEGVIELPERLSRDEWYDWYVGAPDFEVLPLWEWASPVVLRPVPPVRVQGVDDMGVPVANGWRVRSIDSEFDATCMSWLPLPNPWTPLIDGQAQLRPTIRWGTQDTPPVLEFDCGAACTWIQTDWDYEWDDEAHIALAPAKSAAAGADASAFEEAVVCRAFVQAHRDHELPVVRFVDAYGLALSDRPVQIRFGWGSLRETRTGLGGEVAIDLHMSASIESEEPIELRIADRAGHWESTWVLLDPLRAAGEQTFQLEARPIRVQLFGANPQAFSVARAADAPLMHAATDVQSMLEAHWWNDDMLSFQPFGADGWARLSKEGLAGPGCALLRHDASGMLVDLQPVSSSDGLFETPIPFVAPALGHLKVIGSDWLQPNDWIGLKPSGSDGPLKPSGWASIHRGERQLTLPYGAYDVQLGWNDDQSLLVSPSSIEIGADPATLTIHSVWQSVPKRTVRGHVKRAFSEMPMEDLVFQFEAPWLPENWSAEWLTEVTCDPDGNFVLDIPGGPYAESLAFWLDSENPKTSQPTRPTWIDTTHFELDFSLSCLEVVWPEGTVLPSATLELKPVDQAYPQIGLEPSDPYTRQYVASGRYRIQFKGDADEHVTVIELLPGERQTYVVPEPTFGMVTFRVNAPPASSVLVSALRSDDVANKLTFKIRNVAAHNVALPEALVMQAGTYRVELNGEWLVDDLVLTALSTIEFTVRAGQVQQVDLDLSLPFQEQASRALAEHQKSRDKLKAYLQR